MEVRSKPDIENVHNSNIFFLCRRKKKLKSIYTRKVFQIYVLKFYVWDSLSFCYENRNLKFILITTLHLKGKGNANILVRGSKYISHIHQEAGEIFVLSLWISLLHVEITWRIFFREFTCFLNEQISMNASTNIFFQVKVAFH